MALFLQLATGTSVREESTNYIVANNSVAIAKGVVQAFKDEMDCLGEYSSHKVGDVNKNGCYPLEVSYIDPFGDIETSSWELRPVTVIL